MRAIRRIAVVTAVLSCLAAAVVAEPAEDQPEPWRTAEWLQWRGPDRSGVSTETGLAATWPASGPPELWRRPLGAGFSAITVSGGRLFTQFSDGDKSFVAALAAKDGAELWRVALGDRFKNSFGDGPRGTPTLDDGVVYALGATGGLVAVRATDGEVLWQTDTRESFGARVPSWGLSGSPLVEGDLLIVATGGDKSRSVLALDKKTGELRWSARDEEAGYAAPLAVTAAGVRQVLVFLADRIVSLNPADGATFWELGWKTDWGVNATTPILLHPDRLFLSTGYGSGAVMLQLAKAGDGVAVTELWRSGEMRNKFSSSVLYGGTIYGFDEGTLKALDPADGTVKWSERGMGHGSLIAADGKLIVLSDAGKLVLAEATPDGYNALGSVGVFKTKTWTVPTLAGGRLYLRDEKEIVAFDVSK